MKKHEQVVKTVRIGPYLAITSAVWEPARPDQTRKGSYRIACRSMFCDRTYTVQAETDIECVQYVTEGGFTPDALAETARLIQRDHDNRIRPFAEGRVHDRCIANMLAQDRRDVTNEAFRRYMQGHAHLQLWLAYKPTTESEDGKLLVVGEGENEGWPLANPTSIPAVEIDRIGAWVDENTRRIPILPLERPHTAAETPITTLHKDGSVTLWNTQGWVRAGFFEDDVLASLETKTRELVCQHLKLR